jgi:NAD(P)-dependent dehydrogenase (short-subunit alcohol dehydrogenase family)
MAATDTASSASRPFVLVTGASRGLGRATALHLARSDFHVLAGVRDRSDGDRLEAEAVGRVHAVMLDVADDDSIARAVVEVRQVVGVDGLAGLVNNAAVGQGGPIECATRDDLERVFAVNFHGVVLTTNAFLPLLRRARGRVVNVGGGGAGCMAIPLMGIGCASKYALEGMTDALRVELRRAGVRVSLVEPGMTYADADKAVFRESMNSDFDRALSRLPEDQESHYAPALERLRAFNLSFLARAAPPESVARRIHHALTARRPRTRYWCGSETKLSAAISRLAPAVARDAIWGRVTGL